SLEAMPKWRSWLTSNGVSVVGPLIRDRRISLYLMDPDGVLVEITKLNDENVTSDYLYELSRELPVIGEITENMRLTEFNHATPVTSNPEVTVRFFNKMLG